MKKAKSVEIVEEAMKDHKIALRLLGGTTVKELIEEAKAKQKQELVREIEEMRGSRVRLNKKLSQQWLEADGEDWVVKRAFLMQEVWEFLIDNILSSLKEK